jgi:hypothetical protein
MLMGSQSVTCHPLVYSFREEFGPYYHHSVQQRSLAALYSTYPKAWKAESIYLLRDSNLNPVA